MGFVRLGVLDQKVAGFSGLVRECSWTINFRPLWISSPSPGNASLPTCSWPIAPLRAGRQCSAISAPLVAERPRKRRRPRPSGDARWLPAACHQQRFPQSTDRCSGCPLPERYLSRGSARVAGPATAAGAQDPSGRVWVSRTDDQSAPRTLTPMTTAAGSLPPPRTCHERDHWGPW